MITEPKPWVLAYFVSWSRGTGASDTTIRSAVLAFQAQLAGVMTSSPDKHGRDAASFAGLEESTGVRATTDVDAALPGLRLSPHGVGESVLTRRSPTSSAACGRENMW